MLSSFPVQAEVWVQLKEMNLKIPQKPHFADEGDVELFFDGGGHLFGELPDVLRGAAGISLIRQVMIIELTETVEK